MLYCKVVMLFMLASDAKNCARSLLKRISSQIKIASHAKRSSELKSVYFRGFDRKREFAFYFIIDSIT